MSAGYRPEPKEGFEAKALELPTRREWARDDVAAQLALVSEALSAGFEVTYMMNHNYKIKSETAPAVGIKPRENPAAAELAASVGKFTEVMFFRDVHPPPDEAFLRIRATFTDDSEEPEKPNRGKFTDQIQVTLLEPGLAPRELLFRQFVCYERKFRRMSPAWQQGLRA